MAKKHNDNVSSHFPDSLKDHNFYSLKLDAEQEVFRDAIWDTESLIVFCNAKSGTGKTTVATATAHLMVEYGRYDGIVYIASPYAEKEQGYLPGSLEEKSEPYFQPLFQAFEEIRRQPNGTVECFTHTFLRGVNFKHKVVIIDEAQNYTTEALKKVLTRMHDSNKVIVIGHDGQIDLPNKADSGFARCIEHFRRIGDSQVKVCELTTNHRGWIASTADKLRA